MTFALTEKLEEEILQALENQVQSFLLDAEKSVLIFDPSISADECRFYRLPEWTSYSGFNLMEEFTLSLHSLDAKKELLKILHSGRGVFRSFKDKLKEYPEVEKLWHRFKNKKMRLYVNGWYNQLREVWGLEKLNQEPEETCDLIQNDFNFKVYSSSNYKEVLFNLKNAALEKTDDIVSEELRQILFNLWLNQFENADIKTQSGIVCYSNSDEFAGCITAMSVNGETDKAVVLTSFYVSKKFRGLGIGTELLEMFSNTLKDQKKKWVLLTCAIIPDSLVNLLEQSGFKRIGSGFVAEL